MPQYHVIRSPYRIDVAVVMTVKFEDWLRWTEMSKVRGERPSPEDFDVDPSLLLTDDIGRLRYLASRGSVSVATYLRD